MIMKRKSTILLLCILGIFSLACKEIEPVIEENPTNDDDTYVTDGYENYPWPVTDTRENGFVTNYISRMPTYYWNITGCIYTSTQNDKNIASSSGSGFRNHLLFQSMVGLTNKALEKGENDVVLWAYSPAEVGAYKNTHEWLDKSGVQCLGTLSPQQIAFLDESEKGSIRHLIDGYVLTDVANNSESATVATVAAHVYNAIIVDIADKEVFDNEGFEMLYDARKKTTADAWAEFKDKCNNNALVMIPVWMGELRGYAIEHDLFCFNVLKEQDQSGGNNMTMFAEINNWLQPNSPIYGASNYDEGRTAEIISKYGNNWIPYDWGYNTGITSLCYPDRQSDIHCKDFDPTTIDFSNNDAMDFVNFYLSDGDNVQWELNDFRATWWLHGKVVPTKTAFGLSVGQISQIAPSYLVQLFSEQNSCTSVFERGSYYFLDVLGIRKDREAILWQMAQETAAQMKAANVRILGTVSWESTSSKDAKLGYQALVDANDYLEGIITIAYSPYAKSSGEILWIKNKKGIDIPVIRTTYSIWNLGDHNNSDEGTPAYIARKLNEHKNQFNLVCLHCWSKFQDNGGSDDELSENILNPDAYSYDNVIHSSGAAEKCIERLDDKIQVVSLQELIWRIRMKYRPEQTKQLLGMSE